MEDRDQYPNITLVVKAGFPQIEFQQSENEMRILQSGESVTVFLLEVAKRIGFEGDIESIYHATNDMGDEQYLEFPVQEDDNQPISLSFNEIRKVVDKEVEEHSPQKLDTKELTSVVEEYWQADVLSSVVDELYNFLAAETILAASDVGIGIIRLKEDTGNKRFREKMSMELAKLDTELVIV